MKAAYIDHTGSPQQIRYGDFPTPVIGKRDVLVKVIAVAVNAVDTHIRSGGFQTDMPLPFIIGRDMVGEVVEVGEEVSQFHTGDLVWANNQGYDGRQGTFAEYCSIDEHLLYHLPVGVDPHDAITVLHSGLTAVRGFSKAELNPGETIFINGGDGAVGTIVLQIAKALGGRIIVTSGNEQKAHWCQQLGADLIINYKTQDVHQAIKDFSSQGVNVYWDTTTHFDAEKALEVMAHRGRLVVMAGIAQKTTFPVGLFYLRNCSLFGFTVTDSTVDELQAYADQTNQWLTKGALKGRIAQKLPLSQAAKAHEIYETKSLFGKLVLTPELPIFLAILSQTLR
jgi:NADPH:quinone reductase